MNDEDPLAACKGILFTSAIVLILWIAVLVSARCFHHGC
jgi:hypothetical protein